MPAKARRIALPRAARIGIATAVTGAAFALPLVTTISAQAHTAAPAAKTQQSSGWTGSASHDAVVVAEKPAAAEAAKPAAAEESYKVVSGDTLSKIAAAKNVEGGWQALYDHNRSVVGANPNLIHPGQQLGLGTKAAPAAEAPKPAAPAAKPQASHDSVKPAAPAAKPSAKPAAPAQTAAPKPVQAAKPAAPAATQAPKPAAPAPVAAASGYVAPVSAKQGTAYGVAGSMWSSGHHTGVDFAVPTGTSLKAVAAGTVVKAGPGGAYGNEVVIKLADGKYAQYAHLSSISVSAGQAVTAGQQVGLSGATGNVTGPHLHFEIRTTPNYGSDVDPIAYLRSHGVSI